MFPVYGLWTMSHLMSGHSATYLLERPGGAATLPAATGCARGIVAEMASEFLGSFSKHLLAIISRSAGVGTWM